MRSINKFCVKFFRRNQVVFAPTVTFLSESFLLEDPHDCWGYKTGSWKLCSGKLTILLIPYFRVSLIMPTQMFLFFSNYHIFKLDVETPNKCQPHLVASKEDTGFWSNPRSLMRPLCLLFQHSGVQSTQRSPKCVGRRFIFFSQIGKLIHTNYIIFMRSVKISAELLWAKSAFHKMPKIKVLNEHVTPILKHLIKLMHPHIPVFYCSPNLDFQMCYSIHR